MNDNLLLTDNRPTRARDKTRKYHYLAMAISLLFSNWATAALATVKLDRTIRLIMIFKKTIISRLLSVAYDHSI